MDGPANIRNVIRGIGNGLTAMIEGSATPAQVETVVRICQGNAEGILARRPHLNLLIRFHGLDLRDLAFDCISDIFARDDQGRYRSLESYFLPYDASSLSDEECYVHLQRLVFTKVRHAVYRLFQQIDPQLARILRNIKVAVRSLALFNEIDRLGDFCLHPPMCDTLEHLGPVDADRLADWLSREATGGEFIPELLGKLSRILRQQETYSRIVPLVTVGIAIREFYEQKELPRLSEPSATIDDIAIDVEDAIEHACASVKAMTMEKYVGKGKVSGEAFEAYFQVIALMLHMRFVEHDGEGFQLSESFLKLNPKIGPVEYREKHRNRLEYLARIAQKKVAKRLLGK